MHADAYEEAKNKEHIKELRVKVVLEVAAIPNSIHQKILEKVKIFRLLQFNVWTWSQLQWKYKPIQRTGCECDITVDRKDVYTTQKQVLTLNDNKIRITIPAGVEDGQTIKIKGHGGEGLNGGPKGDLYITFQITPDPHFKRIGADLYATQNIDLYSAVLGGEVVIDTFMDKVKLKVAAGTQNGTKVRLKGKGFPVYKNEGQFGDLYLTYNVTIPNNLTEEQLDLFTKLSKLK